MDRLLVFLQSVDWRLVATIGLPASVAIIGWFYVHKLNDQRDLASRKREARLKALEAAYLRIATSMNRPLDQKAIDAIETFVAEIQLYGTPHQVQLAQELVEAFKMPNFEVSYDAILEDLRDTIRRELTMEKIDGPVWWIRFNQIHPDSAPNNALEPGSPPPADPA